MLNSGALTHVGGSKEAYHGRFIKKLLNKRCGVVLCPVHMIQGDKDTYQDNSREAVKRFSKNVSPILILRFF